VILIVCLIFRPHPTNRFCLPSTARTGRQYIWGLAAALHTPHRPKALPLLSSHSPIRRFFRFRPRSAATANMPPKRGSGKRGRGRPRKTPAAAAAVIEVYPVPVLILLGLVPWSSPGRPLAGHFRVSGGAALAFSAFGSVFRVYSGG
jgi:hypothetical protein